MSTSIKTISGFNSLALRSASFPSAASPTIWRLGYLARQEPMPFRITGWSFIRSNFIGLFIFPVRLSERTFRTSFASDFEPLATVSGWVVLAMFVTLQVCIGFLVLNLIESIWPKVMVMGWPMG